MRLEIQNSSTDEATRQYVILPWSKIEARLEAPPERIVIRDLDNRVVPFQIDRVDPNDRSRDEVILFLEQPVAPSATKCLTIEKGDPLPPSLGEAYVDLQVRGGKTFGVSLGNNRLRVWLNLLPICGPDKMEDNWYGGSATSVHLDGLEMLDSFRAQLLENWQGHDPEKRCMQVDTVQIESRTNHSNFETVSIYNLPYNLVRYSGGPVRACVTIASPPFRCNLSTLRRPTPQESELQLYRVISLCPNETFLTEEIYLQARNVSGRPVASEEPVRFNVHFFSQMDMGKEDDIIHRAADNASWFAVGSVWLPRPGYGFAATTEVERPTRTGTDRNRFQWHTKPATSLKCLHLFLRGQVGHPPHNYLESLRRRTGLAWYQVLFDPPKFDIR